MRIPRIAIPKVNWFSDGEKMLDCDVDEKHNAGTKAQQLLCFTCGTTVVVPCYKAGS
jgi:hypothetical protein